ncbi:MAG: aminoglycoside phosphotransferase family protein, partial [Actinomycetota bacterium]
MSGLAMARARHALARAGLDPKLGLTRLSSVTNEVWAAEDYVVRVNRHPVPRLWREATLASLLPPDVGCPPIVGYGGMVGSDWMVNLRLPGEALSRCWPSLTPELRRDSIRQLARRLKALHGFSPNEPLPEFEVPQLLDTSSLGSPVQPTLEALDAAQELPEVDPVVAVQLKVLVRDLEGALDQFPVMGMIHGDLHFENVLWYRDEMTALLDFEYARPAPPDLELDVFLRFCAYPFLHVAPDYQDRTNTEDYADVPGWLVEDLPELFAAERLFDRLRVYSVAYDVRDLIDNPPDRPVEELDHLHPYHRLVGT